MKRILKFSLIILLSLFYFSCSSESDDIPDVKPDPPKPPIEEGTLKFPKKEMRAVWITTAWGLNWQQSVY